MGGAMQYGFTAGRFAAFVITVAITGAAFGVALERGTHPAGAVPLVVREAPTCYASAEALPVSRAAATASAQVVPPTPVGADAVAVPWRTISTAALPRATSTSDYQRVTIANASTEVCVPPLPGDQTRWPKCASAGWISDYWTSPQAVAEFWETHR